MFATLAFGGEPALAQASALEPPPDVEPAVGNVRIYRDRYGMAHVYAKREQDGYFGLGYATAQDRLEQVLFTYRRVEGRLAEYFGSGRIDAVRAGVSEEIAAGVADTVASDRRARRDMALESARTNLTRLPSEYRANVEAFVAGLKQYMQDHPDDVPVWAPDPEPAMVLAVYHGATLGNLDSICEEKLQRATPASAEQHPGRGSNAWAVSSRRTAVGAVIFASDSHGALLQTGPTFYTWRLRAGGIDVLANDFPGSVAMVLAHSRHFGWGWTEGPRFTADCYAVRTGIGSPRTYNYDGTPVEMEVRPYTIAVRGGDPVKGEFEYTRHNGLLAPVVARRGDVAYAVSAAYFGRAGLAEVQFHAMAKATDQREFMEALESREIYPANLIAGGADGTVLYIRPGRIPVRPEGADPTQILDGNTSTTAWRGIHALQDLVQLSDPPAGYIANANVSPDMMVTHSALQPTRYPRYFAFDPGQTNSRQQRINALLSHAERMTLEDAINISLDNTIIGTDSWGPAIHSSADLIHMTLSPDSASAKHFVKELADFDGAFESMSHGALFHIYMREALVRIAPDLVDDLVSAVEGGADLTVDQKQLLGRGVTEAYSELRRHFGEPLPRFGDVFRARRGAVDGPASGAVIVAGVDLHNHRKMQIDGRMLSVRAAPHASIFGSSDPDFRRYLTAGTRVPFVVTFTDPVQSYGASLYGISNDPGSPHFADQLTLIARPALHSNFFDSRELRNNLSGWSDLTVSFSGVVNSVGDGHE